MHIILFWQNTGISWTGSLVRILFLNIQLLMCHVFVFLTIQLWIFWGSCLICNVFLFLFLSKGAFWRQRHRGEISVLNDGKLLVVYNLVWNRAVFWNVHCKRIGILHEFLIVQWLAMNLIRFKGLLNSPPRCVCALDIYLLDLGYHTLWCANIALLMTEEL